MRSTTKELLKNMEFARVLRGTAVDLDLLANQLPHKDSATAEAWRDRADVLREGADDEVDKSLQKALQTGEGVGF